jgi:hypothetical protein
MRNDQNVARPLVVGEGELPLLFKLEALLGGVVADFGHGLSTGESRPTFPTCHPVILAQAKRSAATLEVCAR